LDRRPRRPAGKAGFWGIAIVSAVLIMMMLAGGCSREGAQRHERPPAPVRVATAERRDVPLYVENFGNLMADVSVDIRSQVTGKIQSVQFKEGQIVHEGDVLFEIDPAEYKALLDQAKAKLVVAETDLKLKKLIVDRNTPLLAGKTISQQDYDQSEADYQDALAQRGLAQAAEQLAAVTLGYCTIKSPITGRTANTLLDPGNIVPENTGPPLVNIKRLTPLKLNFTLPERELMRVRQAMDQGTLEVRITGHTIQGNMSTTGTLTLLSNTVDPLTGTFLLQASIPNKDLAFWPGLYVDVRLYVGIQKGALTVPAAAVTEGKQGYFVFVISKDNKAELRSVDLGERSGDMRIINKGVAEGERVVTLGQMGLAPGTPVEVLRGPAPVDDTGDTAAAATTETVTETAENTPKTETETTGATVTK